MIGQLGKQCKMGTGLFGSAGSVQDLSAWYGGWTGGKAGGSLLSTLAEEAQPKA